jgi:hypothetical protein
VRAQRWPENGNSSAGVRSRRKRLSLATKQSSRDSVEAETEDRADRTPSVAENPPRREAGSGV